MIDQDFRNQMNSSVSNSISLNINLIDSGIDNSFKKNLAAIAQKLVKL